MLLQFVTLITNLILCLYLEKATNGDEVPVQLQQSDS
jgi:hypothetical protein